MTRPDALLETAIQASLLAGAEVLRIYNSGDFSVDFKTDQSPLTSADIAAHRIITEALEKTGIPILSEEGQHLPYKERKNWKRLWIVDPVDGTKEFVNKTGDFTINIALVEENTPVMGVIFVPVTGELYFASWHLGSFMVVCAGAETRTSLDKLHAGAQKLPLPRDPERLFTVLASRNHLSPETTDYIEYLHKKHGDIRRVSRGSSLKFCLVAEGVADAYPRFSPTMEWDTAAGHAICKFAGFEVLDYHTRAPVVYNRKDLKNGWFLVGR